MPKAPFTVQDKNATASNLLRSWLQAVGLQISAAAIPGAQFKVTGPDGTINVRVLVEGLQEVQDCVHVHARDLTGKRLDQALEAFWKVTDAVGAARVKPVDRGPEPEANAAGNPRKLHYRDNFHDVAIRHTEFRRSVNPPAEAWKRYEKTMNRVTWRFYRLNEGLCRRNGLEIQDLLQYARCWIVNFCTRYQTDNPTFFDNERKLHQHLQQRFHCDLQPLLLKQERFVIPDAESVSVALFNDVDVDPEVSPDPEDEEADVEYVARHCQLDRSSETARRRTAAAKLDELLGKLGHDGMVETLIQAADNTYSDPGARKEAVRRLHQHQVKCLTCKGKGLYVAPEDIRDVVNIPQANTLSVVRTVVEEVGRGVTGTAALAQAMCRGPRQGRYYKLAAEVLGFILDDQLTEAGHELLETEIGSAEEIDAFRQAIYNGELSAVAWYFDDQTKNVEDLATFLISHFEFKGKRSRGQHISESTVRRRAGTLNNWRRQLS